MSTRPTSLQTVASSSFDPPRIPHWIESWGHIEAQLAAHPQLLLAFGFDELFPPLPPDPEAQPGPRNLLGKLAECSRIQLAFVSGRPIHDIRTRIDLDRAFYAGNHGMEIRGPGFASYDGLAVSCRADLVDALVLLNKYTRRMRGVQIEDKGLTISVSWNVEDYKVGTVIRELMEIIVIGHPRLTFVSGPGVWEVRPRTAWNKANALQQILANLHLPPTATIYFGNAFTDEDAFAALPAGLTFCLGKSHGTAARYWLRNPSDAMAILFCILCSANGMRLS